MIFGQVGACLFTPLPFEDHPNTQAHQTGPRNKPLEELWGMGEINWRIKE